MFKVLIHTSYLTKLRMMLLSSIHLSITQYILDALKFSFFEIHLRLKVFIERALIFEKLFIAILFNSQSFFQKTAERKLPLKCFFHISFCSRYLTLDSNLNLTTNHTHNRTHYLSDYGDF